MSENQQTITEPTPPNYDDLASVEAALFEDEQEPQDQAPEVAEDEAIEDETDQSSTEDQENNLEQGEDDEDSEKPKKDDDNNPDDEDESEEVFTVKVDDKQFEVSQTELIAGYQRQQDYTQKTQAVAEARRTFEKEREGELTQLREALSYYALPTATEPRPEDFAGQPEQFMDAYGQWQEQSKRQTEASQLLEAITTAEMQRTLEREAGLLEKAIPEWKNETVRQADYSRMMKNASDRYGFSPDEIAQVTDHRMLLVLRDAARMAEIESKPVVLKRKTQVKQKLSAGTKVKTDPNANKFKKAFGKLKSNSDLSNVDAQDLLYQ